MIAQQILEPYEVLGIYMEATGVPGTKIGPAIGKGKSYWGQWKSKVKQVENLHKRGAYRAVMQEALKQISDRIMASAADVGKVLDEEILPSLSVLRQVRDNPEEKAGDRMKAALAFIDRAPSGPRKREEGGNVRTVIQIPIKQLEGIKQALIEDGEEDTVKLLEEGKDFNVENDG